MDPEHCEFLAEDELIQIIPRRNEPVLHLVCGDVGPFEAGVPVKVPLWLAVDLRRKQHCEIVPPYWFCLDELKRLVATEGETAGLSRLPPFIFEVSHILIRAAKEDIVDGDQIKVLIQDLWDKREAKLRTSSLKLLSQKEMSTSKQLNDQIKDRRLPAVPFDKPRKKRQSLWNE
ncbi:partner of SLD five, PSF2 [Teladorsagia circumcincta]|uniref:GINS complex subunit 2 n=1 Tax=Teladorsagia circumcincta TaxID=45464 RepID=A0A2G9UMZ7_TELCI|nr:partner of SLD five, PSF2 [Teladorsagia circumcincta]